MVVKQKLFEKAFSLFSMTGSAGQYWLFEKHPLCVKVAYSVAAVFQVLIGFHSNTPVTACVQEQYTIHLHVWWRKKAQN